MCYNNKNRQVNGKNVKNERGKIAKARSYGNEHDRRRSFFYFSNIFEFFQKGLISKSVFFFEIGEKYTCMKTQKNIIKIQGTAYEKEESVFDVGKRKSI